MTDVVAVVADGGVRGVRDDDISGDVGGVLDTVVLGPIMPPLRLALLVLLLLLRRLGYPDVVESFIIPWAGGRRDTAETGTSA